MDSLVAGHRFFPAHQVPVIVSATAALTFPAGGLRGGDCEWIDMEIKDKFVGERTRIRAGLAKGEGMFREGIDYDWATHDLFPAFKFNFKPAAASIDRWVAHLEGLPPAGKSCTRREPGVLARLISKPALFLFKSCGIFLFKIPTRNFRF